MYLYRTNTENQIEVYELVADEEKIREFKKNELDSIPHGKRFMEHTTTRTKLYSKSGIVSCPQYDKNGVIMGLGSSDLFTYQDENEYTNELRSRFIINKFDDLEASKLYKIIGYNKDKEKGKKTYLFVTEYYDNPYKKAVLHNIMILTKSLFVLRSLETGRLDLIEDEDISKELDLFQINFVKSIDWDNLEDLVKYGLVDDAIDAAKTKVDSSSEVLKLKLK